MNTRRPDIFGGMAHSLVDLVGFHVTNAQLQAMLAETHLGMGFFHMFSIFF